MTLKRFETSELVQELIDRKVNVRANWALSPEGNHAVIRLESLEIEGIKMELSR